MSLLDSLEMKSATHTGMVRSHNEDSVELEADIGLAVLADGMGGYNAGEVASGIATALITSETKEALTRLDMQAIERLADCRLLPNSFMMLSLRQTPRFMNPLTASRNMREWARRLLSGCFVIIALL